MCLYKDMCVFFSFSDSIAFHILVFLLFLAAVNGVSLSEIISSGESSTTAMQDSTESEQF